MHVKIVQKNVFVENVWPANLTLFIYVSTHCVDTVKWLDYNRCSKLTRWCSGNASALGARGPGFNPRLRQGFLFDFLFCCCWVFTFLSKTHYLSQKFAILCTILIYLVYLKWCQIYDWLYGYKDTDLASLTVVELSVVCTMPASQRAYDAWVLYNSADTVSATVTCHCDPALGQPCWCVAGQRSCWARSYRRRHGGTWLLGF